MPANTQEMLYSIKRHIYPLSVLLVAISFLHTASTAERFSYTFISLGIFCLLLALVEVLVSSYRTLAEVVYTFTYFFLVAIFCTHFGRVTFDVFHESEPLSALVEGFVWVPVVYMATVVLYPQRQGLIYAWGIFCITLLIGSIQIVLASPNPPIIRAFGDFYLANVIFLLFLYIFVYIYQAFYEARAFAETQEKLAESDESTGLPNRRYLQQCLQELSHKAKWGEKKFAIALCTPKYEVKPKHDYDQGFIDALLKRLAESLSKHLNEAILGRWNAESLLIIWPEYDLEKAMAASKSLAKVYGEMPESLNIIWGVASFLPHDNVDSLITRAGKALDKAKESKSGGVETTQGPFGLRVAE